MALLYKADPVRGEHWRRLFAEHAPDIEWRAWPDIGDPRDIQYLAAWQAPDDVETLLPNLQVLFALSAGVDQLDLGRLPTTLRCKVPLAADSMGLECLWRILLFAGV